MRTARLCDHSLSLTLRAPARSRYFTALLATRSAAGFSNSASKTKVPPANKSIRDSIDRRIV